MFYHHTLDRYVNITFLLGGGPLTRRMNAIKVHSGQNHSNSLSFRGGPARDSIRAATGTGISSDVVYPPGTNHKMGNKLPLSMISEVFPLKKSH